jgi:hypothetical protein
MAITGPKVQVPTPLIPLLDENGVMHPDWTTFLHSLQQTVFALSRSGPTASRPTKNLDGRYIGLQYFDTTLGKTIWLKSVNPDVWVDGTGAAV